MQIVVTDGCDERFIMLCEKLDESLNDMAGGAEQREQYVQYNTLQNIRDVILVLEGETAIGCGSFKKYSDEVAEIKRVFVCETYRGRKLGRTIIEELEGRAKKKGYQKLILETGVNYKSAIRLYEGLGYKVIDNYGPYVNMSDSLCMAKAL